jgi:hypothetical protein
VDHRRPPGGLAQTGQQFSRHPQARFTSATTGPASLLAAVAAAVAAAGRDAPYHFLNDAIGSLEHISTVEISPLLTSVKRTGPVRPGSP